MNISQNPESDIVIKNLELSPNNRFLQDILLWKLTDESLDFLWIVKNSITNAISPWIKDFDSLNETSKKQILGFLNSYGNPAEWKIRTTSQSTKEYSWWFSKEKILELFNDLWWTFWYGLRLWWPWKNIINLNVDWDISLTAPEWKLWYDITDDSAISYRNLFKKINALDDYFNIHHMEMNIKKLELEKWLIQTDPFTMPYDSEYCVKIQQDARIIEEFLRNFLKKDAIGCHVCCLSPISSSRSSDSYIIRWVAALPAFLEVICNTSSWVMKMSYIQTLDNDWIAVRSDLKIS
ncbi:MAG: hypothetical protein ACD_3C00048G0003 [uncultured bacterium (gcode 4)]|uniref:Uncharacterized protein n=1 Tax=uncultured bacterium (gcode 4) TaxID=1234023 RepID=K2G013_9BACT|nr:MAG: hypothetical protein ACD_3C00048G0003 [uncultured bacterium (gcode 4)]